MRQIIIEGNRIGILESVGRPLPKLPLILLLIFGLFGFYGGSAKVDPIPPTVQTVVRSEITLTPTRSPSKTASSTPTTTIPFVQPVLHVSELGIQFIIHQEGGAILHLFTEVGQHCDIGVSHLVHQGPCNGVDPSEKPYLRGISQAGAEELLRQDLVVTENAIFNIINPNLTQYQFDAIADLVYNMGAPNFEETAIDDFINAGDFKAVPTVIMQYTADSRGVVWGGLVKRRQAEALLFCCANYGDIL